MLSSASGGAASCKFQFNTSKCVTYLQLWFGKTKRRRVWLLAARISDRKPFTSHLIIFLTPPHHSRHDHEGRLRSLHCHIKHSLASKRVRFRRPRIQVHEVFRDTDHYWLIRPLILPCLRCPSSSSCLPKLSGIQAKVGHDNDDTTQHYLRQEKSHKSRECQDKTQE